MESNIIRLLADPLARPLPSNKKIDQYFLVERGVVSFAKKRMAFSSTSLCRGAKVAKSLGTKSPASRSLWDTEKRTIRGDGAGKKSRSLSTRSALVALPDATSFAALSSAIIEILHDAGH